jgi:hypothetical protein
MNEEEEEEDEEEEDEEEEDDEGAVGDEEEEDEEVRLFELVGGRRGIWCCLILFCFRRDLREEESESGIGTRIENRWEKVEEAVDE